jgi:sec-independent protein translocase protein TatB
VFDISFTELMLIGVVALVVIGPERLPKVAKTVGHLLGRAQRYVSDVKGDIQREVELDELRKMKEEMETAARSVQTSMQQTEANLRQDLQSPVDSIKGELDGLKSDFEPQMSASSVETVGQEHLPASAPAQIIAPMPDPAVKPEAPESKP